MAFSHWNNIVNISGILVLVIGCLYWSTGTVTNTIVIEITSSLIVLVPFWELKWLIQWNRPNLRDLKSECSVSNVNSLFEVETNNNATNDQINQEVGIQKTGN